MKEALSHSPASSQEQINENDKEALEIIRRINPLFKEIIWESWLRSRTSSFIKAREVYSDATNDQTEPQAVQRIQREKARIKELKKKWHRNAGKEFADFTEQAVVVFAAKLKWFGKDASIKQTDEIDDINRATDFYGHFKYILGNNIVQQSAGFDTTDTARFASQKVSNALRFINYGVLGELLIAETSSDESGKDIKGRQTLLPHFVLVVSRERAVEIARITAEAMETQDWTKLAVHPLQIELLQQLVAQAKAYQAYAKGINQRDYKRSPIRKISTRIARDQRTRETVVKILDRCISIFSAILRERQALIDQNRNTGTPMLRAFLSNINEDEEHKKFIQLFKKGGKGQVDRFRAFLTVLPPVRFNPETNSKTPIKVKTPHGEEELTPRFTKLVGLHEDVPSDRGEDDNKPAST